jgi:ornithine carbamoyltransferase
MGKESESEERAAIFAPYQVNGALMQLAKPHARFMHCLPAHRGQEVTDHVIDSLNSVVFDQAENRLHIQKAILVWLLGGVKGRFSDGSVHAHA